MNKNVRKYPKRRRKKTIKLFNYNIAEGYITTAPMANGLTFGYKYEKVERDEKNEHT